MPARELLPRIQALRNEIIYEENGRWPDESWRRLVAEYQSHVGMTLKIADLLSLVDFLNVVLLLS